MFSSASPAPVPNGARPVPPEPTAEAPRKPRGRPKKKAEPEPPPSKPGILTKVGFKGWGTPLSAVEQINMRDPLKDFFLEVADHADEFIVLTSRTRAPLADPIWGDLEERDAYILTDALLSVGGRSAQVAYAVRGVIKALILYKAGVILLPRFLRTVAAYVERGGFILWAFLPTAR